MTPLRILMVGSSQTWGLKDQLRNIYLSYGIPTQIDAIATARGTLAGNARAALAQIARGPAEDFSSQYDWVVLQENASLQDAIDWNAVLALKNAAARSGAQAIFYMTFPVLQTFLLGNYPDLLDRLMNGTCAIPRCPPNGTSCCRGYVTLANSVELDMPIAPVGQAIVDFHELSHGRVAELFGPGGYHLNRRGKYLAALTIFAAMQGELPEWIWYPGPLESVAAEYKDIARNAVLGSAAGARPWNLR